MSEEIKTTGFKSSDIMYGVASSWNSYTEAEKKLQMKKTNGIFELKVTNDNKEEATWTIDMKKKGAVYKGPASPKADVTIILSDDVLVQLAEGKLNGQKAYLTGQLKTRGNLMLATKLGDLLKGNKAKL